MRCCSGNDVCSSDEVLTIADSLSGDKKPSDRRNTVARGCTPIARVAGAIGLQDSASSGATRRQRQDPMSPLAEWCGDGAAMTFT